MGPGGGAYLAMGLNEAEGRDLPIAANNGLTIAYNTNQGGAAGAKSGLGIASKTQEVGSVSEPPPAPAHAPKKPLRKTNIRNHNKHYNLFK